MLQVKNATNTVPYIWEKWEEWKKDSVDNCKIRGSNDCGHFPLSVIFSSLSFIPPISFKVSRQSACHWSFVYSDKIAAFIACQINFKKGLGRLWRERKMERKGGGVRKQQPYHPILKPGISLNFFLFFICLWQIQALAALLCPPHFLLTLSTVSAVHHLPF